MKPSIKLTAGLALALFTENGEMTNLTGEESTSGRAESSDQGR